MSLDKVKEKTESKRVIIEATKADLDALADVIEKGAKRINVDLYPKEKDLPGRISLDQGSALQITRVRDAMKKIAKGLREEGKGIDVDFGTIDTRDKDPLAKSEWLALMDAVTTKKTKSKIDVSAIGPSIVGSLTDIFEVREFAEGGGGSKTFLSDMEIDWIHAEPLITSELDVPRKVVKKPKDMEGIDQYPPKMNSKDLKAWAKGEGYNRGYIVIADVARLFPLNANVHIKPGRWTDWIDSMPAGNAIMKKMKDKAPNTVGDVLAMTAAYATGRSFDLEKVDVIPFDLSDLGKKGVPYRNRVRTWKNVLSKKTLQSGEEVPVYKNFVGFVVVGKGPYKPMGITRDEKEDEGDFKLPDL